MTRKDAFMQEAVKEAELSLKEGGIPIGAVLVIEGRIVGRGRNKRVQKDSPILHAEMDCLKNAGRMRVEEYRKATLYTTLSPCDMCAGAVLLYEIPRVIIGDNETFKGPEDYLRSRGVCVENLDNGRCKELMGHFIKGNSELWKEDIGI